MYVLMSSFEMCCSGVTSRTEKPATRDAAKQSSKFVASHYMYFSIKPERMLIASSYNTTDITASRDVTSPRRLSLACARASFVLLNVRCAA